MDEWKAQVGKEVGVSRPLEISERVSACQHCSQCTYFSCIAQDRVDAFAVVTADPQVLVLVQRVNDSLLSS